MVENITNTQKGSHNLQIGQQNNNEIDNSINNIEFNVDNSSNAIISNTYTDNHLHIGISPDKACEMAMKLFWDNFPKLQQQAMERVEQLIKEFCDTTIKKLAKEGISDLSAFSTPDMQYILVEAQNSYARFANDELLSNLTDLIVERVRFDKNDYLKIVIDKAIQIIPSLTKNQIDTLTLLFYYKKVKFNFIKSLDELKKHFNLCDSLFSTCSTEGYSLLNSLGCLDLDLASVSQRISSGYTFDKKEIEEICPPNIKELHPDYSPSHMGIIIAIANSNGKTEFQFNPETWIHD